MAFTSLDELLAENTKLTEQVANLHELASKTTRHGKKKSAKTSAEHARQLLNLARAAVSNLREALDGNPRAVRPLLRKSTSWPASVPYHQESREKLVAYLVKNGLGKKAPPKLDRRKSFSLDTPANCVTNHYLKEIQFEQWMLAGLEQRPSATLTLGTFCTRNAKQWGDELTKRAWIAIRHSPKGRQYAELRRQLRELKRQAKRRAEAAGKPGSTQSEFRRLIVCSVKTLARSDL